MDLLKMDALGSAIKGLVIVFTIQDVQELKDTDPDWSTLHRTKK